MPSKRGDGIKVLHSERGSKARRLCSPQFASTHSCEATSSNPGVVRMQPGRLAQSSFYFETIAATHRKVTK